jgi:glycerate dehydrogenase
VGELAHAFGMEVLANTRTPSQCPGYEPFAWCPLEELVERADVISLHCPLTPRTRNLVNQNLLSRCKPTTILINASRGGLVVEQDLAQALNQGHIAAAAVDVVSTEPIEPDNRLLTARNCFITPHMAWATVAARRRLMAATVANVEAFLSGTPINVVN